jgi:hypothetical protein
MAGLLRQTLPGLRFCPFIRAFGATKGSIMDRYISTKVTMHSVSSISCFESVVVGVAILEGSALMHARALLWRWSPSGSGRNQRAAHGFAQV